MALRFATQISPLLNLLLLTINVMVHLQLLDLLLFQQICLIVSIQNCINKRECNSICRNDVWISNRKFFELQSCHSSAEGYSFHQNYHTIEMSAWPYICQFSIFLLVKKQICICINGPGCRCFPPASKASREVANLNKRKNPHTPI